MTYRVLALKYRPQLFKELIGQEHVTHTLMNALRKDRVAHAYLFTGPRGVGKTTTARLLAKALNCLQPDELEPCNQCRICLEITRGNNLDVLEIDGASNRGIDEIRELREAVKYPPTTGKYRIYIIDEVHMLTPQAFNALLKTLEEPPEHIKFILATTDPLKVPATILSRTQRFDFKRVATAELADYLGGILEREGITFEGTALQTLVQKADGSVRDGLSLLDQVIAYQPDNIDEAAVAAILGLIDDGFFAKLLDCIARHDHRGVLAQVAVMFEGGYDIREVCQGFNQYLRDALLTLETGDAKLTSKGSLVPLADDLTSADLITLLQLGLELEGRLRYAQQPRILMEHQLLKMAEHDRVVSIQEVLLSLGDNKPVGATTHQPPAATASKPAPKPAARSELSMETAPAEAKESPPATPPAPTGPADRKFNRSAETDKGAADLPAARSEAPAVAAELPTNAIDGVREHWEEIVNAVEVKSQQMASMLAEVELADLTGNRLTVHLPASRSLQLKIFMDKRHLVEAAILQITSWRIAVLPTIPESQGSGVQTNRKSTARSEVFEELIETFKGEEY